MYLICRNLKIKYKVYFEIPFIIFFTSSWEHKQERIFGIISCSVIETTAFQKYSENIYIQVQENTHSEKREEINISLNTFWNIFQVLSWFVAFQIEVAYWSSCIIKFFYFKGLICSVFTLEILNCQQLNFWSKIIIIIFAIRLLLTKKNSNLIFKNSENTNIHE